MTREQLSRAVGLHARFIRLMKMPKLPLPLEQELYEVADSLARLGVGLDEVKE